MENKINQCKKRKTHHNSTTHLFHEKNSTNLFMCMCVFSEVFLNLLKPSEANRGWNDALVLHIEAAQRQEPKRWAVTNKDKQMFFQMKHLFQECVPTKVWKWDRLGNKRGSFPSNMYERTDWAVMLLESVIDSFSLQFPVNHQQLQSAPVDQPPVYHQTGLFEKHHKITKIRFGQKRNRTDQ